MRVPPPIFMAGLLPALLLVPALALAQADDEANQRNMIATICGSQIPLDAPGCACFADHAMTELDEPQRAYLILTVVQPPAAERHQLARSPEDLRALALFIDRTQKACAAGASSPAPGQAVPSEAGEAQ